MEEQVKKKIKQYLKRFAKGSQLEDDKDIFALGYVNSLFAMQLVLFVEKEFNFLIRNEDLNLDNFRTINSLSNFVMSKLAATM